MKRSVLVGLAAAVTAAAIASVLSRPYLWPSRETKHAHVMEQARAEPGAAIYYQDPDGKPFYSLTPKKTPDGRDYRAVPAGADVSFDDPADAAAAPPADRKIKYYRNPMGLPDVSPTPKKDSMGMDYIPVYEGEDSDDGSVKLSPGKIQRTGVKSEPATRRVIRTVDPRSRHHSARRTARLRDLDARRKLCPESCRRHHGRARRQGPAPDGNLQSRRSRRPPPNTSRPSIPKLPAAARGPTAGARGSG